MLHRFGKYERGGPVDGRKGGYRFFGYAVSSVKSTLKSISDLLVARAARRYFTILHD
jgi:hypothetical protein